MKKSILAILAILVLLTSVYFISKIIDRHVQNELLSEVFQEMSSISSYVQEVSTEIELSERTLKVDGFYYNDLEHAEYVSIATTTLQIPDLNEPTRFVLSNIAKNDTIYAKIDLISGILDPNVPADSKWYSFPFGSIPREFEGIAIPGPILDNIGLFEKGGSYVTLVEKLENPTFLGEGLNTYRLKRTGVLPSDPGPVASLLERIGTEGTIDIWVDEEAKRIYFIVIQNPPYFSTTTISKVNNPLFFETPK